MILPDMTARTRLGAVDMVPLLRRLAGDYSADIPTHERHAAVLALAVHELSVGQIALASGLGQESVEKILRLDAEAKAAAARNARAAVKNREASKRSRAARLAQRVLIGGRLVHPFAPRHGDNSIYNGWGCRCWPCSRAHAAEQTKSRRSAA